MFNGWVTSRDHGLIKMIWFERAKFSSSSCYNRRVAGTRKVLKLWQRTEESDLTV